MNKIIPQVQLWILNRKVLLKNSVYFENLLSIDEKKQYSKILQTDQQNVSICARGALRIILARLLNKKPEKIKFSYTKDKKPYLRGHKIHFSISKRNDLILCAVSKETNLGIDVEYSKKINHLSKIAQIVIPETHLRKIQRSDKRSVHTLFFKYWTICEAYGKYTGKGILVNNKVDIFRLPIYIYHFSPKEKYHATLITKNKVKIIQYTNKNLV
jgi:4'-phosphopantetheinyl transferase